MRRRCKAGLSVERRRPRNAQGLRWDRQLRTHLLSPRKNPHPRPRLRRHRLRPLRLVKRHRYGRQIPVIPSDRPKALLRRHSRIHPLPARQQFVRKARSTVRQERRPRRLLRRLHGNHGPAGNAVPTEARQRSPARQEVQHAPASPMPAIKSTAPSLHPGPAGTAAGGQQTTQARQTARSTASVPTATGSQAGMKAVSNTKAAVKGHTAPTAAKQPTRKQRGKKK